MQPPETLFRQIVRRMPRQPAMLMVDVGAHTRGELATDGVLHGHPAIAFEAGLASCAALKRHTQHVAQKSSVPLTVRCVAVGSRNGTVQFGAPKTFRSDGLSVRTSGYGKSPTVDVPMVRLDDEIRQQLQQLQGSSSSFIMKTDTQGFEMEVLRGAEGMFSRRAARLLFVEISYGTLRKHGTSSLELMEWIHAHGYDCTHLCIFRVPPHSSRARYIPLPSTLYASDKSTISFTDLHELLKSPEPRRDNHSGWTDLLCWPATRLQDTAR